MTLARALEAMRLAQRVMRHQGEQHSSLYERNEAILREFRGPRRNPRPCVRCAKIANHVRNLLPYVRAVDSCAGDDKPGARVDCEIWLEEHERKVRRG